MPTKINMYQFTNYTKAQAEVMADVRDKLLEAQRAIGRLDACIGDGGDWLYEMFGQTSGSITDALAEVATALDARVTGYSDKEEA